MLGKVRSGGGSVVNININSYVTIPLIGRVNDIALINTPEPRTTYIQATEPAVPIENDVWIKTGCTGSVYLKFRNSIVYLTSGLQYINNAWTLIKEWYVYLEDIGWKSNKFYIVNNGVWSFGSLPSNWSQKDGYVWSGERGSGSSNTSFSYSTNHFNIGQYSYLYVNQSNYGGNESATVTYNISVENKVLLSQVIGNPKGYVWQTYNIDLPIESNDNYGKITNTQVIWANQHSSQMKLYNIYAY